MVKITFPLKPKSTGEAVGYLQIGLELLGYAIDDAEKKSKTYGTTTTAAVTDFQKSNKLAVKTLGEVDEITAQALNDAIFLDPEVVSELKKQSQKLDILTQVNNSLAVSGPINTSLSATGPINTSLGAGGAINTSLGVNGAINKTLSGQLGKDGEINKSLGIDGAINKTLSGHLGKDGEINKSLGIDGAINKSLGGEGTINKTLQNQLGEKGVLFGTLKDVKDRLGDQSTLGDIKTNTAKLASLDATMTNQLGEIGRVKDGVAASNGFLESIAGKMGKLDAARQPLSLNARGPEVRELHLSLGKIGYAVPANEREQETFGAGTQQAVFGFQTKYGLKRTGVLDEATKSAVSTAAAGRDSGNMRVEGRVFFDNGPPAAGVTLRLYGKGFGGNDAKLSESTSDDNGFFALLYAISPAGAPGKAAHLEIRVFDSSKKETTISKTKFGSDKNELLHLIVPSAIAPPASEFFQVCARLAPELGNNLGNLEGAVENGARRDYTILRKATGVDARLIAFAAKAVKLKKDTGMEEEALYALFRAGLPLEKERLALASPETVERALAKAKEAGIVDLAGGAAGDALAAFVDFAKQARFSMKAAGTLSSIGDLLDSSGVKTAEKEKFKNLFLFHKGTGNELWAKAAAEGINPDSIEKLKFQGKLAYLTGNNASLIEALRKDADSAEKIPLLADKGLYKSEAWRTKIENLASSLGKDVSALIPPAYGGKDVAERLNAYADDLARKVRLNYPSRVVRGMLKSSELAFKGDTDNGALVTFLENAESLDFKVGETPLNRFLKERGEEAFKGVPKNKIESTTKKAKKLQRMYQIAPSHDSLKAMLDLGFASALDVARLPKRVFLERFGARLPSPLAADLIYRKARQVAAVTLNVLTMAKELDSVPSVYALTPAPANPAVKAAKRAASPALAAGGGVQSELVRHYPSLEELFGSVDFGACDYQRSVLSPAAYLVDLLQFINPGDDEWNDFLASWAATHGGAAYAYGKPYEILIAHRPDLPHIPLTRENTETALPHIDVVSEILEYYVAHQDAERRHTLAGFTGYDTGAATTPELLAEPQSVEPAAYEALNGAVYPLALPFDLALETVRRFADYYETPLHRLLEAFRRSDDLSGPATAAPYYRAQVFAEYLGLSPAEYGIFSLSDPQNSWQTLYGYAGTSEGAATAAAELASAKTLARRLEVTYGQLIELVKTWFVNPKLDALVVLKKLGIEITDVFRYKNPPEDYSDEERQAFEGKLDVFAARFPQTDIRKWLDDGWKSRAFDKIIVLYDPGASSSFEATTIAHADGTALDALEFHKINLLTRLWKRLGWTIEEADRALNVFIPANSVPLTAGNIGAAAQTALVYLAHLKRIDERLDVGKESRVKLLTFWSNIPTTGDDPLYARLFLKPKTLEGDPVFDDPLGDYLPVRVESKKVHLKDHTLVLQGALNLTIDEIRSILAHEAIPFDEAELTLGHASLLYRYRILAKGLKAAVKDVVVLAELSGIDPFTPLAAAPFALAGGTACGIEGDFPFSKTLRFIDAYERLKESGFEMEDADFILRHRFDPVGKHRVLLESVPAFTRALAAGIANIQTQYRAPEDPAALTDDELGRACGLLFPADASEALMSMWKGTNEYTASKTVAAAGSLDPKNFADVDALRVSYDEVRQVQRLVHRGVLVAREKEKLIADHGEPILKDLLADVQGQARLFFDTYLGGLVTEEDFEVIFAPLPPAAGESEKQDAMNDKRRRIARALFPRLREKLVRQLIVQATARRLSVDEDLAETCLTRVSADDEPLFSAFAKAAEPGVSVTFFNAAGERLLEKTAASADTEGKPAGAESARIEGAFEVRQRGAYRFFIGLEKKAARAELAFGHLADPLVRGKAAEDGDELSECVELKPGVLYEFTFSAAALAGGNARLSVQGENLPRGGLERLVLYPLANVGRVRAAATILEKINMLVKGGGFTAREMLHFVAHAEDFDGLDLGKLPARETVGAAEALFAQFMRLMDYAALKKELGGTDDLIAVFEGARRTYPAGASEAPDDAAREEILDVACGRLAELTRREKTTVRAAAARLGFASRERAAGGVTVLEAPDFCQEKGVGRLWDALSSAGLLGVSVDSLADATSVIDVGAPFRDRLAAAGDFKNTVKARYETEDWHAVARPIFDALRGLKRDALTAFVKSVTGFERLEQLFEYFLIDPGMEPVVQTSRMLSAISSVQLFIQRCLMNLEPEVNPAAVNSRQWQWMKRYRIWEANRKIFLYPENWLEPEFRDDKTDLFQELEGAILQGDVSRELVEDAFFNYLKKLEERARLEMVAMYCEETPANPLSDVIHVIGRTFNEPHKYFYRTYSSGSWSPWEAVDADIEGDHLALAVWRGRPHVFWLTFQNAAENSANETVSLENMATKTTKDLTPDQAVKFHLNWSEYYQGKWTDRETGGVNDPLPLSVGKDYESITGRKFEKKAVHLRVSKEYDDGEETALRVHIDFAGYKKAAFRLASKNSPPQIVKIEEEIYQLLESCAREASKICPEEWLRLILNDFATAISLGRTNEKTAIDGFAPVLQKIIKDFKNKHFLDERQFLADVIDAITSLILIKEPKLLSAFARILELKSFYDDPPYLGEERSVNDSQKEKISVENTLYAGTGRLQVMYSEEKEIVEGEVPSVSPSRAKDIISNCGAFRLLACQNKPEAMNWKIRDYAAPFFFQDERYAFFVEPALAGTPIDEWTDWIVTTQTQGGFWDDKDLDQYQVVDKVVQVIPPERGDPPPDSIVQNMLESSVFTFRTNSDWLYASETPLSVDGFAVGREGYVAESRAGQYTGRNAMNKGKETII